MFHVELRRFPHVARAFNLSRQELHGRILSPWLAGQAVELEDRQWEPARTKLTIYEARALAGEEIGLGRGWGAVSRDGEDVTAHLLAAGQRPPPLAELKNRVLLAASERPLPLGQAIELTASTARPSERLNLTEQAVWELLHEGRVRLIESGAVVDPRDWQSVLLDWRAWVDREVSIGV